MAACIDNGAAVADIGTDHGLLPIHLALNGPASEIIATDISKGSLDSARKNAGKYGVADMITLIETPGLDGLEERNIDTVVIAGLGGETIAGIIAEAPWLKERKLKLVLQPQTKTALLCAQLRASGYTIKTAKLTSDRSRHYVVIEVC
ncbi:MAG: class I SAM-dependent methyltransferase [Oscillospiraceae bacterium]|nr:class I SAM-dependent methyltransferase [Oscillospiraceae bacterium]